MSTRKEPSIPSKPTIIDVAKATNLGKTTVSDVLRELPGYGKETRRRVFEAARQLGYRRNHLGSALRGGKTMTLGILGSAPHGPASQAIVRGVEVAARQQGYVTYSVGWGEEDKDKVVKHVEEMIHRRVDGIVFYNPVMGPLTQTTSILAVTDVPIVYIGQAPATASYVVPVDRQRAVNELAQHMAALGHRDAAFVSSQYMQENPDLRIKVYRRAFSHAGINIDTSREWMLPSGADYATGVFDFVARCIKADHLPSLLLLPGDFEAAQALAACHDGGVRVPKDVSIIGFDDNLIAAMLRPSLTTIHQPREEVGEAAFRVLEHVLQNIDAPVEIPNYSCRFVPRQSTGPSPG